MPYEAVAIIARGREHYGWESVEVSWDMDDIIIHANLTTTEISPPNEPILNQWNFPPGEAVMIAASGQLLMHGVVVSYQPQADADQHSIAVTIENQAPRDFAHSSVDHPDGSFPPGTTDSAIVQKFAQRSGVTISDYSSPIAQKDGFQIRPGATNYAEIMRLFQRGKNLVPQMDGTLAVIQGHSFGAGGYLKQGDNVTHMQAKLTFDRFGEYEAIGQSPLGVMLQQNLQVHAEAFDNTMPTSRYKRLIDNAASADHLARMRVEWERRRSAGADIQVKITVPGWRTQSGAFWGINTDIHVHCPWLQVDGMLRAKTVKFIQNLQRGTVTEITLVDPQAYGGEPGVSYSSYIYRYEKPPPDKKKPEEEDTRR
jgi:prophage tail gpP-like protein